VQHIQNMLQRWFGRRIRQSQQNRQAAADQKPAEPAFRPDVPPAAIYKKGDFIDEDHEVCGVLGIGGFGVVYLVDSHEFNRGIYALKTLRDEYLENEQTRERFRREANVWVDLERHPYIVRAHYVKKMAGRLYIAMEYIAPDSEGLNSLAGHLKRRPPDLAQSLRWAIQFCHGMEYAYAMGVRCHRDIKPDNILITSDHILKITDFGIAGILGAAVEEPGVGLIVRNSRIGSSQLTMEGGGFGTPTHMPPEQFTNPESCDERSDIYSFGVVLYQMRTGGKCPFSPPRRNDGSVQEGRDFWRAMHALHTDAPVPELNSRLFPVIERCLQKKPCNRYRSFQELRSELEQMLKGLTAEVITPPELKDHEAWEWNNKGLSLGALKRHDEEILCYEKALEIDPRYADAWINKGLSLHALKRQDEEILCYEKALEIDPRHVLAWNNKGWTLDKLDPIEAIACFSKALEIDPRFTRAWMGKGIALEGLERYEEAVICFSKVLEIDPQYPLARCNKGDALHHLGRHKEAIACYSIAVEIDPRDADAWFSEGVAVSALGRNEDAVTCYSNALEIDPGYTAAWTNKGLSLHALKRHDEAILCYEKALEIDPRDACAWDNKGWALIDLGRHEEAIACYSKALEIDPRDAAARDSKGRALIDLGRPEEAIACYSKALEIDPRCTAAWIGKGIALDALSRPEEAIACYSKALEIDPRDAWFLKGRALRELGRYEEAVACHSKALEIDPQYAPAWFLKGWALDALGRPEEAIACWSKALEIDPSLSADRSAAAT
jgi:tetratricopeptide (TPR) repeat protein/tRNA A-37 threonylcarbamoyl transferase component Bud32